MNNAEKEDFVPSLISLPLSMCQRAEWAREEYIRNPWACQVDEEHIVWCRNEGDGLWYSIAGRYSHCSPEENRIKKHEAAERYARKEASVKELAEKYYREVLYVSGIRKLVLERDNNTCQICHKIATSHLHIHHICKRTEGGQDTLDNLITLCASCHQKADRTLYNPKWE